MKLFTDEFRDEVYTLLETLPQAKGALRVTRFVENHQGGREALDCYCAEGVMGEALVRKGYAEWRLAGRVVEQPCYYLAPTEKTVERLGVSPDALSCSTSYTLPEWAEFLLLGDYVDLSEIVADHAGDSLIMLNDMEGRSLPEIATILRGIEDA